MKKRLAKMLTVVVAFAFVLPVFSLCACTDDSLSEEYECLIGTWYSISGTGSVTVSTDDGKVYLDSGNDQIDGEITYTGCNPDRGDPMFYYYRVVEHGTHITYNIDQELLHIGNITYRKI